MRKFWAILIIIVVILVTMILITYLSPGVKAYAEKIATDRHLPLIIVGLFAPIMKLWQGFTQAISRFFEGENITDIEKKNQELEARLGTVEQKVGDINQWRTTEIAAQRQQIDALNKSIAAVSAQKAATLQTIAQTESTPAINFATGQKYDDFLHDVESDPNFIR